MNISSNSEYRYDQRVFPRQQSIYMRIREMEKTKPVESLGRQIANGIGWAVTLAAIILISSWVH